VEFNNRHKQAELAIEREVLRVLRRLSGSAAHEADAVESELEALANIDRAFARGALADEMQATAPEVKEEGILRLPLLRHPELPMDRVVPNDMRLGEGFHVLVVSGPNAGGKTVAMKALALAALCVRAGLHVPAGDGARVDLFDAILADIGDEATNNPSARISRPSPRTWRTSRASSKPRHRARWSCSTRSAPVPTPARARPSPRRPSRRWPTPERASWRPRTTAC
jgi:hypothetical protein